MVEFILCNRLLLGIGYFIRIRDSGVRPQQVVYNTASIGANGIPAQLTNPFRTNTATAALEFVY